MSGSCRWPGIVILKYPLRPPSLTRIDYHGQKINTFSQSKAKLFQSIKVLRSQQKGN